MSKWYYDRQDSWNRSGGFLIATVGPYVISDKAENEPKWDHLANARLISAAPELLDVLSYAVDVSSEGLPLGENWQAKARAAIAKAKGEQE